MHHTLTDIGNFIFISDEPEQADAIFVVGGSLPELPELAAELWKNGYAPLVFIGGGVSIKRGSLPGPRTKRDIYNKDYKTEYDFYRDVLLRAGIPEYAIAGENRSGYTKQNAQFAREAADALCISPKRALLVCKAFHARRCLMCYQLAFPDTRFRVIPCDGFGITKENWFLPEYGMARVLGELRRCGEQFTGEEPRRYLS